MAVTYNPKLARLQYMVRSLFKPIKYIKSKFKAYKARRKAIQVLKEFNK